MRVLFVRHASLSVPLPTLCTHVDVIAELLPGRECRKGALWVVEVEGGEVRPERYYLRPPPT
jgi:hypothetical protein